MANRRLESERAFRRQYVAGVADRLFADKGIERTTMDEVAAAAELSKSTLYAYFGSKDELLFFMHTRDAQVGYEFLREGVGSGGTGLEQLRRYGQAFLRYYTEHPSKLLLRSYLDFRAVQVERVRPALREEYTQHRDAEIALLAGVIERGVADGSLAKDLDVPLTMAQLVYTLHPIAKQVLFPTHKLGPFEGSAFYDSYLEIFLRGVAGTAADGSE